MPYAANETNQMAGRPVCDPAGGMWMLGWNQTPQPQAKGIFYNKQRARREDDRCNKQSKPMKISAYLRIPHASEEHVPVVVIVAHGHRFSLLRDDVTADAK